MRAVAVEIGTDKWTRVPGFTPGMTTVHLSRARVVEGDGGKGVSVCIIASVRGPAGAPQQMCVARMPASGSESAALDLRFGLEDATFRVALMSTKPLEGAKAPRVVLNGVVSPLSEAVDDVTTDSDQD